MILKNFKKKKKIMSEPKNFWPFFLGKFLGLENKWKFLENSFNF